jgi:3-hydroxyacyl-CoA dehydrogenase
VNTNIQNIAVIGADPRGRAIALACLCAGYATILEDISRSRLEEAVAWLERSLRDVPNPFVGAQHRCAPFATISTSEHVASDSVVVAQHAVPLQNAGRLRTTSVLEDAVRDADLIIESAADELEVKLELFTLFDKFAKPGAILASTSASLSIADMASVTFCADRCIGLRFPDALSSRPLGCALAQPKAEGSAFSLEPNAIELVVTPETSTDTIAACREFARRLSKEVRIIREGDPALSEARPDKSVAQGRFSGPEAFRQRDRGVSANPCSRR